ncbi:hypothetical protein JOD54_004226 [Actinokineospora baliensis]|nr:hypothetical protein [Actinokineospora baliensis]
MGKVVRVVLFGLGVLLLALAAFVGDEVTRQPHQGPVTRSPGGTILLCDPSPGMDPCAPAPSTAPLEFTAVVLIVLGSIAVVGAATLAILSRKRAARRA